MLLPVGLGGCSQDDSNETPAGPAVPMAEADSDSKTSGTAGAGSSSTGARRQYTGISFEIPSDWNEDKTAQMVDSRYIIERDGRELILNMTSMGGGIRANIDRWISQVQKDRGDDAEPTMIDIAGLESVLVDVRGTYNNRVGKDKGVKRDWRLVGVAIPVEGRDFYLKLVGPRDVIADFYDDFMTFVKSAKLD